MSNWVNWLKNGSIAIVGGIAGIFLARLYLLSMFEALYTQRYLLQFGSEGLRSLFWLAQVILLFSGGMICGIVFSSLAAKQLAPSMAVAGGIYAFIELLPLTSLEGIPILPITFFGAVMISVGIYVGCGVVKGIEAWWQARIQPTDGTTG